MKKILLLENKGEISYYLVKDLRNKGFIVHEALDTLDAQSIIEDEGKMDCYIIDLNLRYEGLSPNQIKETINGQITGWIWFRDNVVSFDANAKNKCIIYSDYLGPLAKHVSIEELRGVTLIPKRGTGREENTLDDSIIRILK